MKRWPLAAAALTVTLYAGFRLNECLGTDLVLAFEPPAAALGYLGVLNSKRTPAVLLMFALTLPTAILALRASGRTKRALWAMGFLVADYVWTFAIHVPLVKRLQGQEVIGSDWSWLRARYIADDVVRTGFLIFASVFFFRLAIAPGPSVGPAAVQPTD